MKWKLPLKICERMNSFTLFEGLIILLIYFIVLTPYIRRGFPGYETIVIIIIYMAAIISCGDEK